MLTNIHMKFPRLDCKQFIIWYFFKIVLNCKAMWDISSERLLCSTAFSFLFHAVSLSYERMYPLLTLHHPAIYWPYWLRFSGITYVSQLMLSGESWELKCTQLPKLRKTLHYTVILHSVKRDGNFSDTCTQLFKIILIFIITVFYVNYLYYF